MLVHPRLESMLREWRSECQTQNGRAPREDDLIVPAEGLTFRHKNDGWTEQNEDLQTLGLRHRRQHDFRRTFISLARDGGHTQFRPAVVTATVTVDRVPE